MKFIDKPVLLIVMAVGFLVCACEVVKEPAMAFPTPTPPVALGQLPKIGRIRCSSDANLNRIGVYVWELPGLQPQDNNSSGRGVRGREQGILDACSTILITRYVYSHADKDFYLYAETEKVRGWLKMEFVEFDD